MTKKELSILYAPELTVDAARHRLRSWFQMNPQLMADLHAANYRDNQRVLTARQLQIVYAHLGEPMILREESIHSYIVTYPKLCTLSVLKKVLLYII